MSRLCERPGCSAPASVAYGFDTTAAVVWLERLTAENVDTNRVGALCRRHADSLTAPRHWWLDDRRISVPQLFAVEPAAEHATGEAADVTPPAGRSRRPASAPESAPAAPTETADDPGPPAAPAALRRRRAQDLTGELPLFDVPGPAGAASDQAATSAPEPPAPPHAPSGDDAPDAGAVPPAPTPRSSGFDETVALPWTPAFDPGDDLDGVLSARSPLLSRAFGVVRGPDR